MVACSYEERSPLAFGPNAKTLAYVAAGHEIRLLDVSSGEHLPRVLRGHRDAILSLAFSSDAACLASGSFDNTARIWRLEGPPAEPIELTNHSASVRSVIFSEDDKALLTAAGDRLVKIWDIETQRERFSLGPHSSPVTCMSLDGAIIVTGTSLGTLRIWRTASPTDVVRLQKRARQFLSE